MSNFRSLEMVTVLLIVSKMAPSAGSRRVGITILFFQLINTLQQTRSDKTWCIIVDKVDLHTCAIKKSSMWPKGSKTVSYTVSKHLHIKGAYAKAKWQTGKFKILVIEAKRSNILRVWMNVNMKEGIL